MKTFKPFKTVEAWLKSEPTKGEQKMVIDLINKKLISNQRQFFYKKDQEYHRLLTFMKHTNKMGLELPKEIADKISNLALELEVEFQILWPNGKKHRIKKVKVEDVKVEETIVEVVENQELVNA